MPAAVFALSAFHDDGANKLDTVPCTSTIGSMSTVQNLARATALAISWAEICMLHPDEWVCLLDIELEPDGSIRSARVVGHDPSAVDALDQIDPPDPDTTLVHTAGRRLHMPRFEMTDEIRDLIRARP